MEEQKPVRFVIWHQNEVIELPQSYLSQLQDGRYKYCPMIDILFKRENKENFSGLFRESIYTTQHKYSWNFSDLATFPQEFLLQLTLLGYI